MNLYESTIIAVHPPVPRQCLPDRHIYGGLIFVGCHYLSIVLSQNSSVAGTLTVMIDVLRMVFFLCLNSNCLKFGLNL